MKMTREASLLAPFVGNMGVTYKILCVIVKVWRIYREEVSVGGGLVGFQFFGHLKSNITFNFRSNESSRDILGPLSRYDHP
jgi:hypothetical protein